MCEVREQKAFHSPFNAVRDKPKPSVCFILPREVSETACNRTFLPVVPGMGIFILCFNESRHIWEKETFWTRWVWSSILLHFASFLKHSFENCWCWLTRWFSERKNRCKHVTLIWAIKPHEVKGKQNTQTRINCDRWLLSISLWWEPDFHSTWSWRACHHLSFCRGKVSLPPNSSPLAFFLVYPFSNYDSIITHFLLGSYSPPEPSDLHFWASSLENVVPEDSWIQIMTPELLDFQI